MSVKLFSSEEIKSLELNPNVLKVTRRVILYTDEFKIKACEEYNQGKSARKVFSENGLPVEIIGINRIRGFFQRGCSEPSKTHTPKPTSTREIKRLEKRVSYLEQENEFLKKLKNHR